ncbi:MAG: redoxin domain-containing protein [Planctomycetes bacterium]|nr:redoxin domain-containing protein [Planctomycetota bacterium]
MCVHELQVLQTKLADFEKAGGTAVAISSGSVEDSAAMAESAGLKFTVLSDPELKAIDAWGLRHSDTLMSKEMSRPAAFFLRADGSVADSFQPESYRYTLTEEVITAGFAKTAE